MKLREVCVLLQGSLWGDPDFEVVSVREPEEAETHDLTFLYHKSRLEGVRVSRSQAVVTTRELGEKLPEKNRVVVDNPRYAFVQIIPRFFRLIPQPFGIHPQACVHPTAQLGSRVSVGAFSVVEEGAVIGDGTVIFPQVYVGREVVIGKECLLYPQVVVLERCVVGNRVILQSGVVIGGDGFGYEWWEGKYHKIPHVGRVIIEDEVEIGANTTVDRATLGETRIGAGSKIDNLVMIAHNVFIGEKTIIVAQSGIAGSARIGDQVIMGGQAGVVDHGVVGKGARLAARAGVISEVKEGEMVSGFPARNHREELRRQAFIDKLPEMWKKLRALEGKIAQLFQHE